MASDHHRHARPARAPPGGAEGNTRVRPMFLAFFAIVGAIGVTAGAWPLLTGRNYPGLLGRGFTKGDNLRLKRAPAIYFRAMGAVIASAGLCMFALSVMLGRSS